MNIMMATIEKSYYTQHNGAGLFKIVVKDKTIDIYVEDSDDDSDNDNDEEVDMKIRYTKLLFTIVKYSRIFIGQDINLGRFASGNSILVELKSKMYIFIGSHIYNFQTTDDIIAYESPIGNSNVPYPYAVGTKYIYLMIENVYFPKNFSENKDSYNIYYGEPELIGDKIKEINKTIITQINCKYQR